MPRTHTQTNLHRIPQYTLKLHRINVRQIEKQNVNSKENLLNKETGVPKTKAAFVAQR